MYAQPGRAALGARLGGKDVDGLVDQAYRWALLLVLVVHQADLDQPVALHRLVPERRELAAHSVLVVDVQLLDLKERPAVGVQLPSRGHHVLREGGGARVSDLEAGVLLLYLRGEEEDLGLLVRRHG